MSTKLVLALVACLGVFGCGGGGDPKQAVCGDGACTGSETAQSCAADCKPDTQKTACGDGTCNGAETHASCPADCAQSMQKPSCGDGTCNGTETSVSCPKDCPAGPLCGDGVCNGSETTATCPLDCKSVVCGDLLCSTGETHQSCPVDCASVCGDGVCDVGEHSATCPVDCPDRAGCKNECKNYAFFGCFDMAQDIDDCNLLCNDATGPMIAKFESCADAGSQSCDTSCFNDL